jgi:hypothetical protein
MSRAWISTILPRIRSLASSRQVSFTLKAFREMMELGLDEEDACDVLASVTAEDCAGRIKSKRTREWMYVFKPKVVGIELYVKVLLRSECILISFHEDGSGFDE